MDWDACLSKVGLQDLSGVLLRLVESQEQVATNRLVRSLDRQAVLEEMLETTKPANRAGSARLHYLLSTPFRYPPLKWGSRFGSRAEPSLFYASLETGTVLSEAAYYRCVFWHGMSTPPARKLDTQHTLFSAKYQTAQGLRLQEPPFGAYREVLAHPSDYGASQALGAKMRAGGVAAFEFVSARNREGGLNVALFVPEALADPAPIHQEAWLCELTADGVSFHAVHGKAIYRFPVAAFTVNGGLPLPA